MGAGQLKANSPKPPNGWKGAKGALALLRLRAASKADPDAELFFKTLLAFASARRAVHAFAERRPQGIAALADAAVRQPSLADVFSQVRQPLKETDMQAQLDALYALAPAAQTALDAFCRNLLKEAGMDADAEVGGGGGIRAYTAAPLKCRDRASSKTKTDYRGDASLLLDVVRGSVVCADENAVVSLVKLLVKHYSDESKDVSLVRLKNRFRDPLFNGYRDVFLNLRVRLGAVSMVVELQVHVLNMVQFQSMTYVFYTFFRPFFVGSVEFASKRAEVLETVFLLDAFDDRDTFDSDTLYSQGLLEDNCAPSGGLFRAIERAVECGDGWQLEALDELLEALKAFDLLIVVRERKLDMAITSKGDGSELHSIALHDLASLLSKRGRHEQAEPLFKRALEIWEDQLGPDHPDVAMALSNLGRLLQAQCKFDGAEPLYKRAVGIAEKTFGPDHPNVATALNNHARLLQAQCKHALAEPLYTRALEIRELRLGPDHPDVATSLHDLGRLLHARGKYALAEAPCRRALDIRERALGTRHVDVATTLHCLGRLAYDRGDLKAAEPLFRRALEIWSAQLGPDDAKVCASRHNLAALVKARRVAADSEHYPRLLIIKENQARAANETRVTEFV
mmetsp:Transcript_3932/g.12098  ORF Transcript_3932/g.12098 Transcript_3932/m.12098 type:complete len:625 (-) Transcript_3932:93-1967(-)